MPIEYEKPITIKESIEKIDSKEFLLPAIQRKFVWQPHQIISLFDSMMRGYPINTFMMWNVEALQIKNNFKFYSFLDNYCQRFNESNSPFITLGREKNFKAIIDGQQRLTSIYIGLRGTYAYKKPRAWWPGHWDHNVLPPRNLYINLFKSCKDEDSDSLLEYNFQFLTDSQYKRDEGKQGICWYRLHDAYKLPKVNLSQIPFKIVLPELKKYGLEDNEFAQATLTKLYTLINEEKIIHYYTETSQEIDHVLDVFIRTNSGGTPLSFSDLLMSIAVANWEGDARKDIDQLIKQVQQGSEMGFSIGRDWVLKTCLMLTGADIRFRVKNFDSEQVKTIENNWEKISNCIIETFKLIKFLGINDHSLRAKNAAIPIAYYLYNKQDNGTAIYYSINNLAYHQEERKEISRWLHMVILKGTFGGQGDSLLRKMREIIDNNLNGPIFPLKQIVEEFLGKNKDLCFNEDYLKNLLKIQHGDARCRSVLSLLNPDLNESHIYQIDHLHPKSAFSKDELIKCDFLKNHEDLLHFYLNPENWNSIPNLHLLNSSQNSSKNDRSLAEWLNGSNNTFQKKDLFIGDEISLEFKEFKSFFNARYETLLKKLKKRVYLSDSLTNSASSNAESENIEPDEIEHVDEMVMDSTDGL
ncbi:MAG: DUF262 domain-containing protein [Fibrobacter sp.]|nr:DUF262 domain-containing protein [Fibrobacter sp.]